MALRFLLDANLPRSAVDAVREVGHAVEFARDVGLASATDAAIAARARATGATLITRDLDFADVRQYGVRAGSLRQRRSGERRP